MPMQSVQREQMTLYERNCHVRRSINGESSRPVVESKRMISEGIILIIIITWLLSILRSRYYSTISNAAIRHC